MRAGDPAAGLSRGDDARRALGSPAPCPTPPARAPTASTSRRPPTRPCSRRPTMARPSCSATATLRAVGAPAVAHAGPRLHAGSHRLDERIDPEERFARLYGLSSFFIGEQRVAADLRSDDAGDARRGRARLLCTQIGRRGAPRRVLLFPPLFSTQRGRRPRVRQPRRPAAGDEPAPDPSFNVLFDELLKARVDRLAQEPRPRRALRGGDDLSHGDRGDARADRAALHHRLQRAAGHAARVRRRLHQRRPRRAPSRWRSERASCRHLAADPRHMDTIQRTIVEVAPAADSVLRPPWVDPADDRGRDLRTRRFAETRVFAAKALERRLKVIGLAAAA